MVLETTSPDTQQNTHIPVLLNESIDALNITQDGVYIDATYGRGGHSRAILAKMGKRGQLLSFDKDEEAYTHAQNHLDDERFSIRHAPFFEMERLLNEENMESKVSGIIFDLGISSPQLCIDRGFSFSDDRSLDMRMDRTRGISAAEWINSATQKEIEKVLREFGEERNARKISAIIVKGRPFLTARQLADLVASVPGPVSKKHPATRTFLALRLFVNKELEELSQSLEPAMHLLRSKGRLVVISFHSLEDRIVKHFIRDHSQPRRSPLDLPDDDDYSNVKLSPVGKPVVPSAVELLHNPRARSARMRVAERL